VVSSSVRKKVDQSATDSIEEVLKKYKKSTNFSYEKTRLMMVEVIVKYNSKLAQLVRQLQILEEMQEGKK
jgi:hypothetical protein